MTPSPGLHGTREGRSRGPPYVDSRWRSSSPRVQRMPCPMNTSVRTVFFEDIINYVLNYVPGFRIEVSG